MQALLDAGFTVTALTRPESTATFPPAVTVKRADPSSVDAVAAAIAGNDALVSVAGTPALGAQRVLIDAAIAARVPRFMPSEFGVPLLKWQGTKLVNLMSDKLVAIKYLEELAAKYEWFSWTAISTGLFFDWALRSGVMFIDHKNHKARLVDSGNERFSASSVGFIAAAIVAVLQRPEETANTYLNVAGIMTTQNEVIRMAEELTGAKFDPEPRDSAEVDRIADEKMAQGDHRAFVGLLENFLYADGAGHALPDADSANELLGLKAEGLRESVQRILS